MTNSHPENMIVLYSVNKLLMTKRITLTRKTAKITKSCYGNEKFFSVRTLELGGFPRLAARLTALTEQRHVFIVRGEPLPGTNRERCRRLLHTDGDDAATFGDAPRHWFAVDADKVPAAEHVDIVGDPDGAIEYLIGLLPPELREASCWWQFTTSQGLPGTDGALSARLWFWSHEPVDCAALKRWGGAANKAAGRKVVDTGLYTAVQPHYVASPIFEGIPDPVPRRFGIRRGLDAAVLLVVPDPTPTDPENYGDGGFVGRGVEAFLAEIGGERRFRAPMVGAIASYFATNGPDANPNTIKARVRQAIVAAPPGGRSDADLERYLSDRHLNEIVGWVRQHERANPRRNRAPVDLGVVAEAVLVAEERTGAVRAIAAALIRCDSIPARLALALTEAWNEQHCSPPLAREQVRNIVNTLAGRQAVRVESRNG
jgi:hypothetical protein